MKTWQSAWSGSAIPGSILQGGTGFLIDSMVIRNNTAITWQLSSPGGSTYDVIPAYYAQNVSVPSWQGFQLTGDGATPTSTDTLTITAYNQDAGSPFVQPYGLPGDAFFRVVSLGPNGGIYQGSGTFDSPVSGMKLWNNAGEGEIDFYSGGSVVVSLSASGLSFTLGSLSQAGVSWDGTSFRGPGLTLDATGLAITQAGVSWDGTNFRGAGGAVVLDASGLRTYNGATLECSVGTDGVLTAGGGAVTLDSNGLALTATGAGVLTQKDKIQFAASSVLKGAMYQTYDAGASNILNLTSLASTNETSRVIITAVANTGQSSKVTLEANTGVSGPSPSLTINNPTDPVFQFASNGSNVLTLASDGTLTVGVSGIPTMSSFPAGSGSGFTFDIYQRNSTSPAVRVRENGVILLSNRGSALNDTNMGGLFVDSSGNLWYVSPGANTTKLAAGP